MIFSPHNPNNQLINTGNNAFYFLGKRVFLEKNNDAIKSFWTDVFFLRKTKSPSATTEVMFAIQRMKEKERFFFGLFMILVKHVEFGARSVSNPRWFVCESYFCLPAFSAIIGCQLNLFILFNNAWLSNLHYQLEVSINSKKRRPFPGYYLREFPKT